MALLYGYGVQAVAVGKPNAKRSAAAVGKPNAKRSKNTRSSMKDVVKVKMSKKTRSSMKDVVEVESVLDEDQDIFDEEDNETESSNETGLVDAKVGTTLPNRINMKLGFAERPSQILFEPMPINASLDDLKVSTPWKEHLEREECQSKIAKFLESDNPLFCRSNAKITWSKKYKFAYMRTPKAADVSLVGYFYAQFPDAEELPEGESLPNDVFLFTFVRNPFEHAEAGYQAVDHHLEELAKAGGVQEHYNFREFKHTSVNQRYEHFLRDLESGSFVGSADKVDHKTASTQLSGIVCQTAAKVINFVGHVENLVNDWRIVQHLAGIPMKLRTAALPVFHESNNTMEGSLQLHMLSPQVYEVYCRIYRVDYKCLGYEMPQACATVAGSHDLDISANFTGGDSHVLDSTFSNGTMADEV